MSFYGQVIYEFTKLFNIVSFQNKGINVTDQFGSTSNTALHRFKADERWDTMSIETGNRWIRFAPNEDAQHCVIYHAEPGPLNSITKGFTQIDDKAGLEKTILPPGAVLQVDENSYDAAGHLIGSEKVNYKLPSSVININDSNTDVTSDFTTNKLHFLGDDWINLSGEKSESNKTDEYDRLRFRHKVYRSNDEDIDSFAPIASGGTQLNEGASFQVSNISYDKAGHISGTETTSYKLPFHPTYTGDKTIEGFKKVSAQSGATALNSGDCISTDIVQVDDKGHITGVTTQYYTLPYTDFEASLDDIYEDLQRLENDKVNTSTFNPVATQVDTNKRDIAAFPNNYVANKLFTDTTADLDNRLKAAEDTLKTTIPSTYATKKTVGEISELHNTLDDTQQSVVGAIGPWSNMYSQLGTDADQTNPASISLTSAIGAVDGASGYSKEIAKMLSEDEDTVYTISEALKKVAQEATASSASLSNLNIVIKDLRQRVEALEKK